MRFIGQPEDDLGIRLILGSQLTPETCEFLVGRASLTDDFLPAFITSVTVDIDEAITPGLETSLNQLIKQSKGVDIQRSPKGPIHEKWPPHGKPIYVEPVRTGKMLHLADPVRVVGGLGDPR